MAEYNVIHKADKEVHGGQTFGSHHRCSQGYRQDPCLYAKCCHWNWPGVDCKRCLKLKKR